MPADTEKMEVFCEENCGTSIHLTAGEVDEIRGRHGEIVYACGPCADQVEYELCDCPFRCPIHTWD